MADPDGFQRFVRAMDEAALVFVLGAGALLTLPKKDRIIWGVGYCLGLITVLTLIIQWLTW